MAYFDHFATSPMTGVGRRILLRIVDQEYSFLRKHLNDHRSAILEIGPGRGELADLLIHDGFTNYTAVEPNSLMRESLARKGLRVKNYRIPQIDEADESYDAIVSNDVFEHLNDSNAAQLFISEARRVLRPGGIIYIGCPDFTHWGVDFYNADFSHNNITTVRRTTQLFMNYGLTYVDHTFLSGFVRGRLATVLSLLVRGGMFFVRATNNEQKLYKLKLTFLRRFLIIGRK
ncbi:MAG: class I SAM-dependent methyltransferase [Chloroflexaceae bacterium]|nr:class I SAM-dependent methyltransferase [Chloroflexaceae bacterium]